MTTTPSTTPTGRGSHYYVLSLQAWPPNAPAPIGRTWLGSFTPTVGMDRQGVHENLLRLAQGQDPRFAGAVTTFWSLEHNSL